MENLKKDKQVDFEISRLLELTTTYLSKDVSAHEMECGLFRQLLRLGFVLLTYIFTYKIEELVGFCPHQDGEKLLSKGLKDRKYLSLFGEIELSRPRHWSAQSGSYYELDKRLHLPQSSHWSYLLQELVGENAAENDFRQSVHVLNKLLDLGLSGKSSERNAGRLGDVVEGYYEEKVIEPESPNVCFSASFDGKGVPKIKAKTGAEGNPKKRLGRGEKRGTKQMATVSVTSSFEPKKRTKASIIRGLMDSPLTKMTDKVEATASSQANDNRWHQNIHRRAFLDDQAGAVAYGLDNIRARIKSPNSRFVVPIDAGIGLEEKVLAYVEQHGMEKQFDGIILDIIHVTEYVWEVATATLGEKSELRSHWVRDMLNDLLDSKTTKVIEDLEFIRDKGNLSKSKQAQVSKTITYFTNHKHKMDYKIFIEKGYPVSSALVEAACGHLVKDRMEQSGMRWSSNGAQHIMDLRAVKTQRGYRRFYEVCHTTGASKLFECCRLT